MSARSRISPVKQEERCLIPEPGFVPLRRGDRNGDAKPLMVR